LHRPSGRIAASGSDSSTAGGKAAQAVISLKSVNGSNSEDGTMSGGSPETKLRVFGKSHAVDRVIADVSKTYTNRDEMGYQAGGRGRELGVTGCTDRPVARQDGNAGRRPAVHRRSRPAPAASRAMPPESGV
jgi:hypothetical protein